MKHRGCGFITAKGPCASPKLRDSDFCLWHSPEHAAEVKESRRLGGLRRKREVTVSGAYEFEGLATVEGIRRIVEVAVLDTLGMENSIARSRTLAYLAQVALRALEVGDMTERIEALERAVQGQRLQRATPAFDAEASATDVTGREEP